MSAKLGINWDEQPLGKMTDEALGEKLGCAGASVYYQRTKRGIPPYGKRGGDHVAPAPAEKRVTVTGFTFTVHVQDRYRQKFPGRCRGLDQAALVKMMGAELTKAREMGELIRDDNLRHEINKWNQQKRDREAGRAPTEVPEMHFYGVDDAGPMAVDAFNDVCLTRRLLNHRPIYVVAPDDYTVVTVLKMAEFMGSINYGLNVVTAPKSEPITLSSEPLEHRPLAALASLPVPPPKPAPVAAAAPAPAPAPAAPATEDEYRSLPPNLLADVEIVSANSSMDRFDVLELLVKRGLADLRKKHPQLFTPLRKLLEQWGDDE